MPSSLPMEKLLTSSLPRAAGCVVRLFLSLPISQAPLPPCVPAPGWCSTTSPLCVPRLPSLACLYLVYFQRISYAKTKSHATLRREDPNFVPPRLVHTDRLPSNQINGKRSREGGAADDERTLKREKSDDSDEEMEIDDDEDEDSSKTPNKTLCTSCRIIRILWLHDTYSKSGNTLHNTPAGVNTYCTPAMHESTRRGHRRCTLSAIPAVCLDHSLRLSCLLSYSRHPGLQSIQVAWSPTPNATGARVKMAQVVYENSDLAIAAKNGLDGFLLKKDWQMSVSYIWILRHYAKASDNFFARGSAEAGFWPVMSFPSTTTWACN